MAIYRRLLVRVRADFFRSVFLCFSGSSLLSDAGLFVDF